MSKRKKTFEIQNDKFLKEFNCNNIENSKEPEPEILKHYLANNLYNLFYITKILFKILFFSSPS